MAQTVIIIGAGITGALCSSSLSKHLPKLNIKVYDKARGVGGRMTTSRSSGNVCAIAQADLGAQYISTDKYHLEKHHDIYFPLTKQSILKPLETNIEGMKPFKEGTENFTVPGGMGSLVKHFLSDLPSTNISLNYQITSIEERLDKLFVQNTNGGSEEAEVIISTIPVPQFLKLEGIATLVSDELLIHLKNVAYSSRFVLIWFYDSLNLFPLPSWGAKYLEDDVFRYVAIDNVKRGQNEPVAVVFHTSIQFGAKNISRSKEDLEGELNSRARLLFPEWPTPVSIKCHKWLHSQVTKAYPGEPGCLVIRSKPTLILAGDAFSSSNFNGCIASSQAAVKATLEALS